MNLENFPSSSAGARMLEYVTEGWYDKAYVGKWIYQVMGLSIDEVEKIYQELPEQMFPETATWGLRYHEIKYGLPVGEGLELSERRSRILQKQMIRIGITPYNMERLLDGAAEFKVYVSDIHDPSDYIKKPDHPNQFQIVLIGDGTADIEGIRKIISQVKQSHTVYEIFYYEKSEAKQNISWDNHLRLQSQYYPRQNQEYLFLDGSWALDDSYVLNGYKRGSKADFYPVIVNYQTEVKAIVSTEAGVTVENSLDGQWILNGDRELNGGYKAL